MKYLREGDCNTARLVWKDIINKDEPILSINNWYGEVSSLHKVIGDTLMHEIEWKETCKNAKCKSVERLMKTENYFQYCFLIDPANIMGDFNKYLQHTIDQMRCPRTGPFQHDSNLEVDVLIDPNRCKGPTVQHEKIVKKFPHILSFTCLQP